MKKNVLILIPAHNEEKNIKELLRLMMEYKISDWADIVVVNDGSNDNTKEIVAKYGVEVINLLYNMGYGSALQVGYKYATIKNYEYLIQLDADGQHDVSNLENIYKALTRDDKGSKNMPDIVIGSRFLEESVSCKVTSVKKIAIKFFRKLIKKVSGVKITDPTSGLQGLNRKAFSYYAEYSNFDYKYPDINMIIQMLLQGFRIVEIPVIMHERKEGTSMHSGFVKPVKYMILMMLSTMNAIYRNHK
ncbi:MAG TPA: glycosyltransferase family 2 protein [Lachnospiraceae bacterium]|nr:glycosyltransferase family 2 protein [Lachnospiraceae bacterium]